jgi:hypothetical protein
MTDQLELDWLTEERPAPLPLDCGTTARVRTELLTSGAAKGSFRPRFRQTDRLRSRASRVALSGVALAACAGVAMLATEGGRPSSGSGLRSSVVQSASAKQLNHLSIKLASDAAPIGDATLVLRTQSYPNSPAMTGADLYADNGDYYYATALSGLPAAIKANETVNSGSSDQEVRDIDAAKAALTGPIDAAREQMSTANLDPGVKPQTIDPHETIAQETAGVPAAMRQQLEQKLKQVQANDAAQDVQSEMTQENGMIWDNSMDALLAGAGDPQVRAGVLKLLATVPQIQATQSTLDGQPTLDLTASLLSSKSGIYQEQLILNANTGIPLEMIGGNVGQTPSVTVDYTISRVTVSSIENGTYSG